MRLLLPALLACCAMPPCRGAEAVRPNVILILCDDLGYADVGYQGAKHATPNVDRFAREGVRLTSFYTAANVCTPTRASIMTGCYPRRVGLQTNETGGVVLFPGNKHGISADEVTLAELFRGQGYATACFGKWHLGDQPVFLPPRHGFDRYFGIPFSNDMGQTDRPVKAKKYPPLPLLDGEKVLEREPDQRTLTRRYTEQTVKFIEDHAARPFFIYLPHTMPHWPHYSSEEFAGKSGNGKYGDTVTEIDWSLGEILASLQKHKLDERTLVVFTSDNGGPVFQGATNTPLRGAKGSTWEGGHRVAFAARWPGKIPAGTSSAEMAITFDLYTTLAKLAGAHPPADRIVDGKDIWPILSGEPRAKSPHDAFFYYRLDQLQAVRSGKWKLHLPRTDQPANAKKAAQEFPLQLYDLEADLAEEHNIAAMHPAVVEELQALATRCRSDLGEGPSPGPGCRAPGSVDNPQTLTSAEETTSVKQGLREGRIAR